MPENSERPAGTGSLPGFGALDGLKVVDLTRVLGGPYCTQILADHGAHVTKIEPPQGDEVRDWGPPFHEHGEGGQDASYFIGVNRNKRAMALDLRVPEARELLLRMLEDADVLIENYKPGAMEKWGLGYQQTLCERFPRLIHARISGFGADGPYGGFPGYDAIIQAMAGMFSVNGEPDSGPTRLGIAIVDMGTGLYTAIALLMALHERHRSGRGQFIDMTLYDCAVGLMHPHVSNYNLSGKVPQTVGSAHHNIAPYGKFHTRTTDIFVGAGNNRAFARLCDELGVPALKDDPRFADNGDRVVNREALDAELAPVLAQCDGHALCDSLLRAGLPAGPIRNTKEVLEHEHTLHREMAVEHGWYRGTGIPIKFSRTPGEIRRPPPRFAEHTRELLHEHGLSDGDIDALVAAGAVVEQRR